MRKVLLALVGLAAGAALSQTPVTYTLADVAKHATKADCWMVLNTSKVYNFSAYIATHPGGGSITASCGKDGTAAFNGVGHSGGAVTDEIPYLIGTLVGTPPPAGPITVSVAPTSAALDVGASQQFTATLTNTKQGVDWNLVPTTLGTVTAAGLFKAGAVGVGSVAAISKEDPTKFSFVMITVRPGATPPPVVTNPVPTATISDHFARHAVVFQAKGAKACTSCHGAKLDGGTALASGTHVYPVADKTFSGPKACYTVPFGSPDFPRADFFGTEVYPAIVCTGTNAAKGLAVYTASTPIACAQCHKESFIKTRHTHGNGRDD
jgi:hypothetical protein